MAMTLRLTADEQRALKEQAAAEGRSMQDVARAAVRNYIAREAHVHRRDAAAAQVVAKHAEALRRLGDL